MLASAATSCLRRPGVRRIRPSVCTGRRRARRSRRNIASSAFDITPPSAWVVLGVRDLERGQLAAVETGGKLLHLDVTDAGSIAAAASAVPALDVLANNNGISPDIADSVTEADVEVFRRTYETNVFGVVAVT